MDEIKVFGTILWMVIIIVCLVLIINHQRKKINKLKFSNKSQSVLHGNKIEQWIPFMKEYPYDPQEFKFLGKPVDGIHFGEDKIVLLEFKTGKSQLNDNQKRVKDLVEKNKVYFKVIRI